MESDLKYGPGTNRGQFILLSNLAVDEMGSNTSLLQLVHWFRNDNLNQFSLFQMIFGVAKGEKASQSQLKTILLTNPAIFHPVSNPTSRPFSESFVYKQNVNLKIYICI